MGRVWIIWVLFNESSIALNFPATEENGKQKWRTSQLLSFLSSWNYRRRLFITLYAMNSPCSLISVSDKGPPPHYCHHRMWDSLLGCLNQALSPPYCLTPSSVDHTLKEQCTFPILLPARDHLSLKALLPWDIYSPRAGSLWCADCDSSIMAGHGPDLFPVQAD